MTHTLLLADDSVTIQRVIELTFADEDVTVIAVSDGEQAIARLDAAPPDIVLADIGMPGRNGYEVAQYIKQNPKLAHIPVVLLTGAFEPVDQAKAAAAGCDGVLAKPFEPQQVIGRVRELLARGSAAPADAAPAAAPPPAAAPKPAPVDIDTYFDRLDAAFTNLSKDPAPPPPASAAPVREVDWFNTPPPGPAPDLPLSFASPEAAFDRLPAAKLAAEHTPPAPAPDKASPSTPWVAPAPRVPPASSAPLAPLAPVAPSAPPASLAPALAFPPIADAFAALLAAEQRGPSPSGAPQWPAAPESPAPAVEVSDEVIERVTRRVLEQLSDRVVRETVSGIVSAVADRLVRDEIDRIKSSIK